MLDGELRATFILRLWREQDTPPGQWRGEVEHVQSAHVARFGARAALFAYLDSRLSEMEGHSLSQSPVTNRE